MTTMCVQSEDRPLWTQWDSRFAYGDERSALVSAALLRRIAAIARNRRSACSSRVRAMAVTHLCGSRPVF